VLRGLCRFYYAQGALQTARELGEELFSLAQRTAAPLHLLEAQDALGTALFQLGEYAAARTYLEQSPARTDLTAQRALVLHSGDVPEVRRLVYVANTLWCLGYPAQAVQWCQDALTLAQRVEHPQSLGIAQNMVIMVYHRCREVLAVQAQAEALLSLETFPLFAGQEMFWRGWVLVMQGESEAGLAQDAPGYGSSPGHGAGAVAAALSGPARRGGGAHRPSRGGPAPARRGARS
jgi:tetratricopeptide (TPR) repeat protein